MPHRHREKNNVCRIFFIISLFNDFGFMLQIYVKSIKVQKLLCVTYCMLLFVELTEFPPYHEGCSYGREHVRCGE